MNRSLAVIEFSLDGTITSANDNFLKTMGNGLEEIRGKRHRIFVEEAFARSNDYTRF
ncbi:MAG: hypothetical protein SH809_05635 [Rhodothermales bacterium]|nr:hypothetical protein [Rhodothermales bacterium]